MNILFEKFTEKHIDDAVKLALSELEAERSSCPDIPCGDFSEKLKGMLTWLCTQPIGKAAFCGGKMVGYLIFGGPWDGFFGNVKGAYSPLGGSAVSYEYADRQRLASMLFESTAQRSSSKTACLAAPLQDTRTTRTPQERLFSTASAYDAVTQFAV